VIPHTLAKPTAYGSNFLSSRGLYFRYFKQWGVNPNIQTEDWRAILTIRRNRRNEGKATRVTRNGGEVPGARFVQDEPDPDFRFVEGTGGPPA
jgi:hypothetical protein